MAHFPPPSIPQYGPSGQIPQFTPQPQYHPAYMPVQQHMMNQMPISVVYASSPQQFALAQTHAQRVVPPQMLSTASQAEINALSGKTQFLISAAKWLDWDFLKDMAANRAAEEINVKRAEGAPQVTAATLKSQLQLQPSPAISYPLPPPQVQQSVAQFPVLMMQPAQPQMASQPKILNDTQLQQMFREVMGREPNPSKPGKVGDLEFVKKEFAERFPGQLLTEANLRPFLNQLKTELIEFKMVDKRYDESFKAAASKIFEGGLPDAKLRQLKEILLKNNPELSKKDIYKAMSDFVNEEREKALQKRIGKPLDLTFGWF